MLEAFEAYVADFEPTSGSFAVELDTALKPQIQFLHGISKIPPLIITHF